MRRASAAAGWAFVVLGACTPDIGPCDLPAALEVVYLDTGIAARDDNGVPMYAGQALVHASCSGAASCHSSSARGASRLGVPHGFDFDLGTRCIADACLDDGSLLESGRRELLAWAPHVVSDLDRGTMPPGERGRAVMAAGPTPRRLDAEGFAKLREEAASLADVGVALPDVTTTEGREIVRNWLACGAPAVERTATPIGVLPGSPCDRETRSGSCVHRVRIAAVPPEATFASIYEDYLAPSCAGCHGDGPLDRRSESRLDLSSIDVAYASLVGDDHGAACSGARVIPYDPESSLLLDKLGPSPSCGAPMAGGRGADAGVLDAVRAWIESGAPR